MIKEKLKPFTTPYSEDRLIEGIQKYTEPILTSQFPFATTMLADIYPIGIPEFRFDTARMVALSSYSLPVDIHIKESENVETLKSFRALDDNWNGFGANKPTDGSIENSINIVKVIENLFGYKVDICYPLDNGGIQIDVTSSNFNYEIEVHDDSIELFKFDQGNSLTENISLTRENIFDISEYF